MSFAPKFKEKKEMSTYDRTRQTRHMEHRHAQQIAPLLFLHFRTRRRQLLPISQQRSSLHSEGIQYISEESALRGEHAFWKPGRSRGEEDGRIGFWGQVVMYHDRLWS